MSSIAGTKSGLTWAVHISVVALVLLWLFPTVGLFVSSFRTADQISSSGWWDALFPQEQNLVMRTADPDTQRQEGAQFVIALHEEARRLGDGRGQHAVGHGRHDLGMGHILARHQRIQARRYRGYGR